MRTATHSRNEKSRRARKASPPTLSRLIRVLQARLPELSKQHRVISLGVFGSYVRRTEKQDSDLDILVELKPNRSLYDFVELQEYLSELLGVKVDLVQNETLRPYIGARIRREVIWLQKDGIPQTITLPRRRNGTNGRKNGGTMEPEREYLDYLQDMLDSMAKAERHIAGMTLKQVIEDEKTLDAVKGAVQTVGEAASRIPREIRERYPHMDWGQIVGMRNIIVHGYGRIKYDQLWKALTESIPRDQPLIAEILKAEKERRKKDNGEKRNPG